MTKKGRTFASKELASLARKASFPVVFIDQVPDEKGEDHRL